MAEPLLAVEGVSRRFGGVLAVDGVDLRVERGELLGIIGPNGAGKTTLFNLISGFARPTAGRIRPRGRRIDHMPTYRIARLGVCRTFQNLRLSPTLTVFDNVSAGTIGAEGFPAWRAVLPGAGTRRRGIVAALNQSYLFRLAELSMLFVILAASLNLVSGTAGLISLGQVAACLGARRFLASPLAVDSRRVVSA